MPEQMIKKLKNSISPQWKVCFVWAVVMGLVAHLYKITNWLPNWDGLVFRYDSQNMISMGRWFLPVVTSFSSFYDLPFLTGLMAIIFHSIGAVCIAKMFGVKRNITAALIGALIATFPTVSSVMMYGYVSDGYAFSFLLSCIAAMLMTKDKPCYITSAVLIALSCAIYQAYVTVTIMLILLSLILELLYKNTDLKNHLTKCLKFFITGFMGMVLYYLVLTILLEITGVTLLEYQGFDGVTGFKGIDILGALYAIKETFVRYFFDVSSGINVFVILNVIVFILTFAMYLKDVIKYRLSIAKIIILIIYVCLLPVGASVLSFLNSGIDYHNLMKMGFAVFYLFMILQYEKSVSKRRNQNAIKMWSILSVTTILVFNQVVIANVSYHKLNMAYEKSYGTLIRIADRIEQTDGAKECDSILILGHLSESEAYSAYLPPDMTGTTDGYILRADDEIVGQSVLCSALNDYCGKKYNFVSGKEKTELLNTIDTQSLDIWPEKNCVCIIDNVIVIKLGD